MGRGGRPRAGHLWTIDRKGRMVIGDDYGNLILSSEAMGWARCARCRKPAQNLLGQHGWCPNCWYLHGIEAGTFWQHKAGYLFPYNISSRLMRTFERGVERALDDRRKIRP